MTVRVLAAAVTVVVGLLVTRLVVEDPGLIRTAAGKLTEGGMWTALAVFIAAAVALGYRRRHAAGRSRPDRR